MLPRLSARLLAPLAVVALLVGLVGPAEAAQRPAKLYVNPQSAAAWAAQTDTRFAPIAKRAQALWLTDGLTKQAVTGAVRDYTSAAVAKRRTPVLTVYAIPDRDCHGYSTGGFTPTYYGQWVRRLAAGFGRSKPIVVLEPDAIAQMGDPTCTDTAMRTKLLAKATRVLAKAGAWVYLDAGHSSWRDPAAIAGLLKASGVAKARGFSTNVANYRPTADEVAYADAVNTGLAGLGVTGKKYVIDTGRNGAAVPPAADDWCNPVEARLGARPRMVRKGALDAYLWVKNPGESDGGTSSLDPADQCHGGPGAGQWWSYGALRLLGLA